MLFSLLVCGALAADPLPPDPAAPTAPTVADLPAVHLRMAEHFRISSLARSAVLRGDLDDAVAQGKALAALKADDQPDSWKPFSSDLSQSGRELSSAPSIEQAALAVGGMATVCSNCHAQLQGGPKLPPDATPLDWTTETHMTRHLWAGEWIWLGILANDDEALKRGATVLAGGPVVLPSTTPDRQVVEWETQTHRIAREMLAAPDLASRRALYGPLLAQCGACHLHLESEAATPR